MNYRLLLTTTGEVASFSFGYWVANNYQQQYRALTNPTYFRQDGRIGAMLAARDFNSNQVGYGVFAAIRLIHLIFGNIGEQRIGTVFNSPQAQRIMASPRTYINHRRLGLMEYQYWQEQQGQGASILDEFMIQFGASVPPFFRALIQEGLAQLRNQFNNP